MNGLMINYSKSIFRSAVIGMYRIAIVEDEKEFRNQLQQYLKQYSEENHVSFQIVEFGDGEEILEEYKKEYDLILLDIEMPKVNGMDAAEKIREKDEEVVLMFITNMAQYAIRGYSVGALDFIMKPITYYTFSMKMTRALKRVRPSGQAPLLLNTLDGVKSLEAKQIYYVEVQNRMLHYYTDEGEIVVRGTLQSAEESLQAYAFAKCNHWYVVNLAHVKEVAKNIAVVGPYEVEISRRNRASFLKALTEFMGGNR